MLSFERNTLLLVAIVHLSLFSIGGLFMLRCWYLGSLYALQYAVVKAPFRRFSEHQCNNKTENSFNKEMQQIHTKKSFVLSASFRKFFMLGSFFGQLAFFLVQLFLGDYLLCLSTLFFASLYLLTAAVLGFSVVFYLNRFSAKLQIFNELLASLVLMLAVLFFVLPAVFFFCFYRSKFSDHAAELVVRLLVSWFPFFFSSIHLFIALFYPLYLQRKLDSNTVEEKFDLDAFLEDKNNFQTLRNLAKRLLCVELLDFWKLVKRYKGLLVETSASILRYNICNCFLREGASMQLNLDCKLQSDLWERKKEPDPQRKFFDGALKEVLRMIKDNLYTFYLTEKKS